MAKREAAIQSAVCNWAKSKGLPVLRRTVLPGTSQGWPDVQFILPAGRCAFIEFKAPGEVPTKLQAYRLETLKELGHDAGYFDDKAKAIEWLDGLRRDAIDACG